MAKAAKPAKGRALKVYRTAIGFHDAYVAAPSKKAALSAWGTDKDLFARGAAEVVEDPALTAEALAAPGTVIRRTRGSLAEQLAAAGPTRVEATDAADTKAKPRAKPARPKPRPSRAEFDAAEAALAAAQASADEEDKALRQEEDALRRRRAELERKRHDAFTQLDDELDRVRRKYEAAMERWRADG